MSKMTKKFLTRYRNKNEKDEPSSTTADLDEEMEKVFAMSEGDKFDFSKFTIDESEQKSQRRYTEGEFSSSHRKRSYPHIHLPIKGLRSHLSKKSKASSSEGGGGGGDSSSGSSFNIVKVPFISKDAHRKEDRLDGGGDNIANPEQKKSVYYDDSYQEPALSERAAATPVRDSSSPDRRVQFNIDPGETGEITDELSTNFSKNVDEESHKNLSERKVKRKHSHHYKRTRKHSESSKYKKQSSTDEQEDNGFQLILQLEEPLQEFLQDDLTSHRFDCARDKRRFSAKSAISSRLNRRGTESSIISSLPLKIYKKSFDHSPHEVFVQLDELIGAGEDREWKETARWIKYEEDLEEGAERWGRPHVASLSFHSLLNLRRCLETGVVLLDLEEKELPGVAYRVVEQMSVDQLIKEDEKATVIRALLLRHRHVNYHERFRFIRRNTSSYTSLQGMEEVVNGHAAFYTNNNLHEDQKSKKQDVTPSVKTYAINSDGTKSKVTMIDMKEEVYMSSTEDLSRKAKEKESILKRIPAGAEATTVLVGTVDFLQEPAIAFVRLAEGIFLPAVTEVTIPVRFMFILLGPPKADVDYHEVGRSISTLMSNTDFNKKAYKATDRRDLLRAINEFLDYSIVLPPGNWERDALLSLRELRAKNEAIRKRRSGVQERLLGNIELDGEKKDKDYDYDDPLRRTNTPFGGMINDIKRRVPYYKSDFLDGFNCQCLSASIFMYFAALSAAITFGGLFADKTKNMIGISETLISTSVCGIIFGFLAGQPLIIIGTTGPLLLFDESLFKFCQENNIEYLTMRVYIGLWLFVIALLVASIEGSVFIKVFTRFTEEIFSSLISLLYIYESVSNLLSVFKKHPLMSLTDYCSLSNSTNNSSYFLNNKTEESTTSPLPLPPAQSYMNQPNTALLCLILSMGTFFLALYLRHFRNSKFLGRSVRRALGDFGVPIALVTMVTLDAAIPGTYTEKLVVPEGLSPSKPGRAWLIPPLGLDGQFPVWAMFASIIPAILVYILVFMETHISELIIGKKERKLKKGNGFHLDIVLVCLTNVGCGILGAPWMCAATVRSVTHVSSVTVMSRTHAPGEKPHIIQVKEQRVSSLVVSALVGLSVLMAPFLRLVPMAVLFGVFLYMGISSIDGVQFFERLKLFLMPVKHHPQTAYVRKVPTVKMYLFTLIQLLCLVLLWTIKSSVLSLSFPFFLILMVPLRAQLSLIFLPSELRALDSDEPDAIDKEDDEPDFYAESLLPG